MLSTKLRGGDTSHDAMIKQVDKELKDADAQLKQAQEQLEYVVLLSVLLSKKWTTYRKR